MVSKSARGPRSGGVQPQGQAPPFLPTMDPADYRAAKEAAENAAYAPKSAIVSSLELLRPNVPPTEKFVDFDGVNQTAACTCRPPDPEGAVGRQHYVQTTNSHYDVYTKALPNPNIQSMTLAAHQGASEFIFDPRAIFDRTWNRYVTIATRVSTSGTDTCRCFYLAVSQTGNPTGAWWLYIVGLGTPAGTWVDYPQLGHNQDALFVTANMFTFAGAYSSTVLVTMAKARPYNGLQLTGVYYDGLPGTMSPPHVVEPDQNTKSFFIAADSPAAGDFPLYSLQNAAYPASTSLVFEGFTTPASPYGVPPSADQAGTTVNLDTLDTRFVNASSQVGNTLWQTHTIALGAFPAPRYYKIDTTSRAVTQSAFYFASGTSHDWNASITSNLSGDVATAYSSTDPPAGIQAESRVDGQELADPAFGGSGGSALFTSPTFYVGGGLNPERWGDYSDISIEPVGLGPACPTGKRQWVTNQKNDSPTVWGTRITRVGYC